MLTPLLGKTTLMQQIGAFGPVTVEHSWPHGSERASWEIRTNQFHPLLRGGTLVQIFDGGIPIWYGFLNEPDPGSGVLEAIGSWREAERMMARDGFGALSSVPDIVVFDGIYTFGLRWTFPANVSGTAWSTSNDGSMSVTQLLDNWSIGAGRRWYINPLGQCLSAVDPTVALWHVPHAVAGRGLAPAEDEFYSHLSARYLSAAATYATVAAGSAAAASVFRRRDGLVDLTPKGIISAGTAQTELNNIFALVGARMGFAEGLELGYGQITTAGGAAAPLSQITAGQMVRLVGVLDTSRPQLTASNLDIVIGSSKYTDGSGRIALTPMGKANRNLDEILKAGLQ